MDEEWIAYFVIVLDAMSFLIELRLVPNDEYNGLMWTWVK